MPHRIRAFETFTVEIPIEAPLRHSYAVHSAFKRTLLCLTTEDGVRGWGETAAPERLLQEFRSVVVGEDPFHLEKMRMRIGQRGYHSRQALVAAAVEIACYDLQGRIVGRPVCDLLGGALREAIDLAAYVFYRYAQDRYPEVYTPEQVVAHTQDLIARYGFSVVKLKGGVHPPAHDVEVIIALRRALGPDVLLRLDPNAVWTPETAIRMGQRLERAAVDLEYLEDPTWGLPGMSAVRTQVGFPLATNMCVTDFEHVPPAVAYRAVDIVLSDPWYWGGLHNTRVLSTMVATFGMGLGMHSGLETGIGLSAMLHVASTLPNLTHAIDSHYHHMLDDVLEGGMLTYQGGTMKVPTGPGLGVEVDRDKVRALATRPLADSEQPPYTPDPRRPDWYARYPGW